MLYFGWTEWTYRWGKGRQGKKTAREEGNGNVDEGRKGRVEEGKGRKDREG